jgi:hypothetical protein
MRRRLELFIATASGVGLLAAGAAGHAATLAPFAEYSQTGTKTTIVWKRSGLLGGSIFATSPDATFDFLDTSKYLSNLPARLTLLATASGVAAFGGPADEQDGIAGAFNFKYTGPTTTFMGLTYTHDATNLLTGVFTLARISGLGTSGGFHDSTAVGTITYTSDIIDFSSSTASDFSFSLSGITPPLGFTSGRALNTFSASATGAFSAAFSAIPEPATWTTVIVGIGLIGLAARRRRALRIV